MPHFRVDDGLDGHPKAQRAGDEALGMWLRAGSWCMRYLTDGFIPEWWVRQQPKGVAKAKRLVEAGFWHTAEQAGEKGWQFHEFLGPGRQDSREKIEAEREAARLRKAKSRQGSQQESHQESQRDTPESGDGNSNETGVKNVNTTGATNAVHSALHRRNRGDKSARRDEVRSDPTSINTHTSRRDTPRDGRRTPGTNPTQPNPEENSPTEESSPNVGGDERGLSAPVAPSASRLVSTLIPPTIPDSVRAGLRIQASQLINGDRIDGDVVAEALRRWLSRPGSGVGLLPSLASDVIRERAAPATANGGGSKLRAVANLAARQRAAEKAHTDTQLRELE